MVEGLNRIRRFPEDQYTIRQRIFDVASACAMGYMLGIAFKIFEKTPVLSHLCGSLETWILLATLVICWSRTPLAATLNVLSFFLAILGGYCMYQKEIVGFIPSDTIVIWMTYSLIMPFLGLLLWYARGEGWAAAILAALPISILMSRGLDSLGGLFHETFFDVVAGVLLIWILPQLAKQRIKVIITSTVLTVLLYQSGMVTAIILEVQEYLASI